MNASKDRLYELVEIGCTAAHFLVICIFCFVENCLKCAFGQCSCEPQSSIPEVRNRRSGRVLPEPSRLRRIVVF